MAILHKQYNFDKGEVSPQFLGRVDLESYRNALATSRNAIVTPVGSIRKRPGTSHTALATGNGVRLFPFQVSATNNFILEFGDEVVRFFQNHSALPIVLTGGRGSSLESPYAVTILNDLKVAQFQDGLYITNRNTIPRVLVRRADDDWEFIDDLAGYWNYKPLETLPFTVNEITGEPDAPPEEEPDAEEEMPTPVITIAADNTIISENGGTALITASSDIASDQNYTINVSVHPITPTVAANYTVSNNKALALAMGAQASTGVVSIIAVNNMVDEADKQIEVRAAISNTNFSIAPIRITIRDDDNPIVTIVQPSVTIAASSTTLPEANGMANISATLSEAATGSTSVRLAKNDDMLYGDTPAGRATTLMNRTIVIPAGATTGTTTAQLVTRPNNIHTGDRQFMITGAATNVNGVASQPDPITITVEDDDPMPVVVADVSAMFVVTQRSTVDDRDGVYNLTLDDSTGEFSFKRGSLLLSSRLDNPADEDLEWRLSIRKLASAGTNRSRLRGFQQLIRAGSLQATQKKTLDFFGSYLGYRFQIIATRVQGNVELAPITFNALPWITPPNPGGPR